MACPSVIAQVLAAGAYDDGHRGQQDGDASENGADRIREENCPIGRYVLAWPNDVRPLIG